MPSAGSGPTFDAQASGHDAPRLRQGKEIVRKAEFDGTCVIEAGSVTLIEDRVEGAEVVCQLRQRACADEIMRQARPHGRVPLLIVEGTPLMPMPLAILLLLMLGIPVAYVLFSGMVIFGGLFVSRTSPVGCCFLVGLAAFIAAGVMLKEVGQGTPARLASTTLVYASWTRSDALNLN